jgi:hypothetical protein
VPQEDPLHAGAPQSLYIDKISEGDDGEVVLDRESWIGDNETVRRYCCLFGVARSRSCN